MADDLRGAPGENDPDDLEPDDLEPDDLEPVSGDPLDMSFEVENVGEDPGDADLDDRAEPGGVDDPDALDGLGSVDDQSAEAAAGDARYTIDPQLGESPPPEQTNPGGETTADGPDDVVDDVVNDDDDDPWPWDEPTPFPAEPASDLGMGAADVSDVPPEPGSEWDPPPSTDTLFSPDELGTVAGQESGEPAPFADDLAVAGDLPDALFPEVEADAAAGDDHQPSPPALPIADLPAEELAAESDAGDAALEVGGAEGLDAWEAPIASYDDPLLSHGDAPEIADDPSDWASFTDEHYIRSSTSDYQGLAEEFAARVGTDADVAPSAVAAGIPGVETGVVGLDDVVEGPASEHEPADDTARTPTDLGIRVLTGIGLVAVFAAALFYRNGLTVLATVLFGLAAGEFYAVLGRVGRKPLSLFGLVGVVGGLVGTALWGLSAIPIAITATLVAVALYYALSSPRPDPLTDGGLTVLVVTWALLGAFVFPIIDSPDWRWWIVAVVVVVAAMDIGQYFIGRRLGSRPLAPVVSPHKTVEGYIGGAVIALAVAAVLGFFEPLTLPGTISLALATVVLAPLGDLSVSLLKRIIGVKDMGTILPGHGGILDRVDGLLFVIPAAWVILESMGLLT